MSSEVQVPRTYDPFQFHIRSNATHGWELVKNSSHEVKEVAGDPAHFGQPAIPFRLVDSASIEPDKTGFIHIGHAIEIQIDEYGDKCSGKRGTPIFVEQYEGDLRVALWADINQEDCTHSVLMEGARLEFSAELFDEDKQYPKREWKAQIADDYTTLSYKEWVEQQRQAESRACAAKRREAVRGMAKRGET